MGYFARRFIVGDDVDKYGMYALGITVVLYNGSGADGANLNMIPVVTCASKYNYIHSE